MGSGLLSELSYRLHYGQHTYFIGALIRYLERLARKMQLSYMKKKSQRSAETYFEELEVIDALTNGEVVLSYLILFIHVFQQFE